MACTRPGAAPTFPSETERVDSANIQLGSAYSNVSRFGFVRGVSASSMPHPEVNLTGDPYVTDGLPLVVFLNEPSQTFDQIEVLDWER